MKKSAKIAEKKNFAKKCVKFLKMDLRGWVRYVLCVFELATKMVKIDRFKVKVSKFSFPLKKGYMPLSVLASISKFWVRPKY